MAAVSLDYFQPSNGRRVSRARRIVVFTGTFQRALDGKLRVLIPKRLRMGLGDDKPIYLTPGTDHCLELHSDQSLNELAIRTSQSSADSRNIRSFSRLFYARAQVCDIDKQGRIRIPASLSELAKFEKNVVFVGVGSHWELWDSDRWTEYLNQNDDTFDQIVQKTFDSLTIRKSDSLSDKNVAFTNRTVSVPPHTITPK